MTPPSTGPAHSQWNIVSGPTNTVSETAPPSRAGATSECPPQSNSALTSSSPRWPDRSVPCRCKGAPSLRVPNCLVRPSPPLAVRAPQNPPGRHCPTVSLSVNGDRPLEDLPALLSPRDQVVEYGREVDISRAGHLLAAAFSAGPGLAPRNSNSGSDPTASDRKPAPSPRHCLLPRAAPANTRPHSPRFHPDIRQSALRIPFWLLLFVPAAT